MKEIVLEEEEDYKKSALIKTDSILLMERGLNLFDQFVITNTFKTTREDIKKINQAIEEGE
jgi:hypothetical protein